MAEKGMRTLVRVMRLAKPAPGVFAWDVQYTAWATLETADQNNLFSAVGIGARGAVLHMWKNDRLDLHHAIQLHDGRYCFLTSIIPDGDGIHVTVQAAIVEYTAARADLQAAKTRDKLNRPTAESGGTLTFPCVLTEVYRKNEPDDVSRVITRQVVAVAPKPIILRAGDTLHLTDSNPYVVRTEYTLDPYKNEYLAERLEDV